MDWTMSSGAGPQMRRHITRSFHLCHSKYYETNLQLSSTNSVSSWEKSSAASTVSQKFRRREWKSLTQSAVSTSASTWCVFGTSASSTQLTLICEDRKSGQTGATQGNGREEISQTETQTQILTTFMLSGTSAVAGGISSMLGAEGVPEVSPFWLSKTANDTSLKLTEVLSIAMVEPAAGALVTSRGTAMVRASVTNGRDSSQRPAWLSHLPLNNDKSTTFKGFIVSAFTLPLTRTCSC